MTMPYEYQDQEQDAYDSGYEGRQPVPVKVQYEESQNAAPAFTALTLVSVLQAGSAVATGAAFQLVTHRYHRFKAKFTTTIPANTVLYLATKPDAFGNIVPGATAPVGFIYALIAGQSIPDYDGQQPLYAAWSGAGPGPVIAVMDESYGKVQ